MGTGGWGSSAFSSPLGMAFLAGRQLLGRPPQWATPTQQSPVGALLASGWPRMKYGSSCKEIQHHVKCHRWAMQWRNYCISSSLRQGRACDFIHDCSQSDDTLLGHPWSPHHWPIWSRVRVKGGGWVDGLGWGETVQLYCTMQQSDSGLLLCQINIEVSGAPHCSSISACCLEEGKGCVTWELPLSSFILAKLALDSQDIKDYCDSMVADRVSWGDKTISSLFSRNTSRRKLLHVNTVLTHNEIIREIVI